MIAANQQNQRSVILIVDDEVSICKTLQGIFADENYETHVANAGEQALELLAQINPAVILLDIWLPGMDGLETLKKIKAIQPNTPVIMISGHATIATAISATKLGASDFIEKPLDLHLTLAAVRRALEGQKTDALNPQYVKGGDESLLGLTKTRDLPRLNPIVFKQQNLRGKKVVQKTLSTSALLYGQGLHSGKKSGLILEPLPPNSGIHFRSIAGSDVVPAHLDYVDSTGFATTIKLGQTQAGTIEHLMSALHAAGVSNLLIKCNGEVPVMDGSALEFCKLFEDVGLEEQDGDWFEIAVDKTLRVEKGKEFIQIEPADSFIVEYTLDYPKPLGRQQLSFELSSLDAYKNEIAAARTFGLVRDIGYLQTQGLALGGRFDNFVLFGEDGPINCKLRFDNEPVRHKILDLIGDIYLLGRPIRGKISASMTGHSDNIAILKLIQQACL